MSMKTEKPTPKKLSDEAKKGKTFKGHDQLLALLLLAGATYLYAVIDLHPLANSLRAVISGGFRMPPDEYAGQLLLIYLQTALPFVLVCLLPIVGISLWQSKFALAFEALHPKLDNLNPVNGVKKLFKIKTVKDFIKALLHIAVWIAAAWMFWSYHREALFAQVNMTAPAIGATWLRLGFQLVTFYLLVALPLLLIDALVEYLLFMKDMRMDKHEVKQEYKQSEGNPEVKGKRRQLHMEMLSAQIKSDISQSQFLLANPTHVAIGIFINFDALPLPFVSVRETGVRALAVLAYARSIGVPVVTDPPLARRIYRECRVYSFIRLETVDRIFRVLAWLSEVERAGCPDAAQESTESAPDAELPAHAAAETLSGRGVPGEKTARPNQDKSDTDLPAL